MSFDISDLNLEPEVTAEINKRHEASEQGLKDNRDKVLAQNAKLKAILGAADDDDLAKKLSDEISAKDSEINQLKTDLLTAKGDKDALEKHKQQIELDAKTKQQEITQRFETQIKNSAQDAFLEKILGKVHEDKQRFARADLMNMADTTIDDNGVAVTVLKDGDKVFRSVDEFLSHAEQDKSWSGMIKAPDTQGAGLSGNNGNSGVAATTRETSDRTNSYLATMKV